jgi:hypothetical protein
MKYADGFDWNVMMSGGYTGEKMAVATNYFNIKGQIERMSSNIRLKANRANEGPQWRVAYDRAYTQLREAAEKLWQDFEESSQIPEYLAPAATGFTTINSAPPVSRVAYKETRGMGPSGKGLPTSGPGSIEFENQAWLNTK